MTRLLALVVVLGALAMGVTAARAALQPRSSGCGDQPFAQAQVPGAARLTLELAATDEQRSRGLMFRESLPEDQGMLFVFEQQTNASFWMRNTLIPLSIAYIDRDGTILDIQDMQPEAPGYPTPIYPPASPYWYALEVNQGWYARNGVNVGDVFAFCLPAA